jgi:hypothetical protein
VPGTHLGSTINFSFSLKCSLYSCGVCYFVAPSLTRGRVCTLLLLVLQRSPTELKTIFHCPNSLDSPNLESPGPRIYIPQEQGGPDIPPGTGFPFRCLLRLVRLRWRYSNPPPQGIVIEFWEGLIAFDATCTALKLRAYAFVAAVTLSSSCLATTWGYTDWLEEFMKNVTGVVSGGMIQIGSGTDKAMWGWIHRDRQLYHRHKPIDLSASGPSRHILSF